MIVQIKRAINYILYGIQPKNIRATISVYKEGKRLEDQRIVVTGGGRGLGFAIAKRCIEEGANVLIVGRNEDNLKKAAEQYPNCHYLRYDVSDTTDVSAFFTKAEEILGGPITSLVNNAGISLHEGNIFNVTEESFVKQINVNLKAPYFLSKEFLKRYRASGLLKGAILFITSERGLYCDDIPYGLIKAAINSLTEGLGRRFINEGIRVNAIAPGVTASDMTGYSEDGNLYRPQACGERVYLAQEVAETAIFLLSEESGCISSQIIPCNRGNHLRCDW